MSFLQPFYEFKTRYKQGYTRDEMKKLLEKFPGISESAFWNILTGQTGIVVDGEFLTYHNDIERALVAAFSKQPAPPN